MEYINLSKRAGPRQLSPTAPARVRWRAAQTPVGIRRGGNKAGIAAIPWPVDSTRANREKGLKDRGKDATRRPAREQDKRAPDRH